MQMVFMLIRSHLWEQKVRTLLASLAIACSVCLLILITSMYSSAIRSLDKYASRALGHYILVVDPISRKADREVMPEALELLRNDQEVAIADPMWAELISLTAEKKTTQGRRYREAVIDTGIEDIAIGTDASIPPFPLLQGRWIGDDATEEVEVVLGQKFAEYLEVEVGDRLLVPGPTSDRPRLSVVGIIEPPPESITGQVVGSRMLPSPSVGAAFFSMRDARTIRGTEPKITFVGVVLKPEVDVHTFRYRMMPKLYGLPKPAQFMTDVDMEEEMSEAAQASNMTLQAYVVGIVATVLAFLVVFSTLSMGVSERTRHFALLRAVALTKRQLAALVVGEGLLLTILGLTFGIPVGWLLIQLFDQATEGVVRHGISVHWTSVTLAGLISAGAALLAGILPAWRATRVKPLDAVGPQNKVGEGQIFPVWCLWLALLLLGVLPILSFLFPPGLTDPVYDRLLIGAASLAAGLLLLAPFLVLAVDRLLTPWMARLFGLPSYLLEQQISSQLWRSVGCAVTLSVGLGLGAAIHVWGWSMVETFIPTSWAPDATLVFKRPLTDKAIQKLKATKNARFEPLMIEQPRMRDDVLNSAEHPSVTRQMVLVLAGINPEAAFGGTSPLIETTWTAGSPDTAITMMNSERGCVVPDHFLSQSGLKVGDELYLIPPENPTHPVPYKIAGAVKVRGGQWMTKVTGMRIRTHRSSGLVFASYKTVAEDFALPGPRHGWVHSTDEPLDTDSILREAKSSYESEGISITDDMRDTEVRIVPTAEIGATIVRSATFWLWVMSVVPLIALGISSIAVLNMFLASVRARQWDFGVLRALGFTRSTLVRIVIAEGILIGCVACVLGCAFGLIAGWSGTALSQVTSWFGGMETALKVPWLPLTLGCLATLLFSGLATVWPALRIGFTSPLTLLSQGRSRE
ncbi:ABC transporter [Planctomycetales bacterium 10988]|nr:ABC transporter [Planctomycetales bacterium 10988]